MLHLLLQSQFLEQSSSVAVEQVGGEYSDFERLKQASTVKS